MKSNSLFVPLGELFKTTSGGTPSRSNSSYYNGSIPWVKSGELKESIIFDTEEHISDDALKKSSAKLFPKGTLLIALYGATIGRLAILGVNAATNQAICGIFPTAYIDLKYTYYYLLYSKPKLIQKGIGGAQPNINQDILRNQLFPLRSFTEQRAIVAKLEQLFSELDNGIVCLKKAQEQLKVYRQAILKQAFEGELTKAWREQQTSLPSAQELLETIKTEREQAAKLQSKKFKLVIPLTQFELDDLPKMPDGWLFAKSAEIIDAINNGYTPTSNFLFSGSGEVPFIKVYNLNFDGTLNFKKNPTFIPKAIHEKKLLRSIVYPADVLINIVGPPLGKVSIATEEYPEWNINQAIVVFRPNKYVSSRYISLYLQNPATVHWLENTSRATAGQYNIKVSTCREIPFPFCSPQEQSQIVEEIETRLSVCDNMEATIKESLEKAEALRQSILKKAFEGKLLSLEELQITRNAPDWEPAEKLLERIRAEKRTAR